MSTNARAILDEVKNLPAEDQREISRELMRWLDQAAVSPPTGDSIRSARGMFAGSRLTAALLASRAEERRRG